jgi:hypothetical protein
MNEPKHPGGRPPLPEGQRAESHLHLRVTRARKTAYVRAANVKKTTLAKWCFGHLDAASGYKDEDPAPPA